MACLSKRVMVLVGLLALVLWLWPRGEEEPARPSAPEGEVGRSVYAGTEPAEPGGIEGLVRRDGRPVAARVEVFTAPFADRDAVATVKAGTNGKFSVGGLAPGAYELHAEAPDGGAANAAVAVPDAGARVRVEIDLRAGGLVLRGRAVFADGRPFTGLVHCGAWTRANATGRFRIEAGLGPGVHPISFLLPGVFRLDGRRVCLPAEDETTFVLDVGGRALKGRVIAAADGAPIAGAEVQVGVAGFRCGTTTDAAGRFAARTPRADGGISVAAEGYCPLTAGLMAERTEVEIPLDPTDEVRGRVVTEDGTPVAGVRVFEASSLGRKTLGEETVTDEKGRFRLCGVRVHEQRLFARGRGWISADLADAVLHGWKPLAALDGSAPAGETTIVVVPADRLEGRVLDEAGTAVADATVTARPRGDGSRRLTGPQGSLGTGTAKTDAAGRFRIDVPPAGLVFDVVAEARGFLAGSASVLSPASAEAAEVEIRLATGRYVRVRAVDGETGEPIGGASVSASFRKPLGNRVVTGVGTVTTSDGRARVGPLYPGTVTLSGRHPEYFGTGPGVAVEAGSDTEVVLRFTPGFWIGGRVLLPDGSPATHGWVSTYPAEAGEDRSAERRGPLAEGGRFRIPGHPPGRYRVVVSAEGEGRNFGAEFLAPAGREDLEIPVRADPDSDAGVRSRFRIRVLGPEGRPVPRARLCATSSTGGDLSTWNMVVALGDAWMDVDAGTRQIWLEIRDVRSSSGAPLPCSSGRYGPFTTADSPVEIRLTASTAVSGVVLGPDGAGLPGLTVSAFPARPVDGFDTVQATATTDQTGRFRIDRLGDRGYRFVVRSEELGTAEAFTRGGAESVVIRLGSVSARVRILDSTGSPVTGAEAWAVAESYSCDGPDRFRAGGGAAGPDGVVVLRNLDVHARYTLEVNGGHGHPYSSTEIADWTPADLEVVLPERLAVAGVVRDRTGRPVTEAEVWGQGHDGAWTCAGTDEEGRFDLAPVFTAGPVLLLAKTDDSWDLPLASDTRLVAVAAGRRDVELLLPPSGHLRIRVENAPGNGFLHGSIATAGGLWWQDFDGSEDGTIVIDDLDPEGHYSLVIFNRTGDSTLGWFGTGLRPGPDEIAVKLAPCGAVRGRLDLPDHVFSACVWLEGPGFLCSGVVRPDGTFEVAEVPPGRFTLHAAAQLPHGWIRTSAPAGPGDDLRLSLR